MAQILNNGEMPTMPWCWILVFGVHSALSGLRVQNVFAGAASPDLDLSIVFIGRQLVQQTTGAPEDAIVLVNQLGPFPTDYPAESGSTSS